MWNIIPQVTQEWSTEVLGWVFSNICGPIETTSIKGYQYFITFTNNFSCYTHIGLCKSKDYALNIFKMWKACMEKEMGQTLKSCTQMVVANTPQMLSAHIWLSMVLNVNLPMHTHHKRMVSLNGPTRHSTTLCTP